MNQWSDQLESLLDLFKGPALLMKHEISSMTGQVLRSYSIQLPLDTRKDNTLREDTLGEEIQKNGRQNHHNRGCHDVMGIDRVKRIEGLQPNSQSPMLRAVQVDQRLIEIIPGVKKMEDGYRDQGGPSLRQDDVQQDLQRRSPIDPGGIVQLERDGHEELPQEKDIIGVGEELRDDQRQQCIHPTQLIEEYIGRKQTHLAGEHDGGEQQDEQDIEPGCSE